MEDNKKTWNKNTIKICKNLIKTFQETTNELTKKKEVGEKGIIKLSQYLNNLHMCFDDYPYEKTEFIESTEVGIQLSQVLNVSIDYLSKSVFDSNTNDVYAIIFRLIIFEGYQPYNIQNFSIEKINSSLSNLFISLYHSLLKCTLYFTSCLSNCEELETVQNVKIKIKKITEI